MLAEARAIFTDLGGPAVGSRESRRSPRRTSAELAG